MSLLPLLQAIQNHPAFLQWVNLLEQHEAGPLFALPRAARLPVIAATYQKNISPILLISDRSDHTLNLIAELSLWLPGTMLLPFPEPTPLFYENAPWSERTQQERMRAFATLATYRIPGAPRPEKPPILVASARALMTRTLPRRMFLRHTRSLKKGQVISPTQLAQRCMQNAYQPVTTVVRGGQFSRRGGLMDIWPPSDRYPSRLEFFGDEIDTLRQFDPATQRTISPIDRVLLTPAREIVVQEDEQEELTEFHIPLLFDQPGSLIDYLPSNARIFVEDIQALEDTVAEFESQALELRSHAIGESHLPEDFPVPYFGWDEIQDELLQKNAVALGPFSESEETPLHPLAKAFTSNPRFGGQLKPFLEHIDILSRKKESIIMVSRQASRLQELWKENQSLDEDERGKVVFLSGSLSAGWRLQQAGQPDTHLFSDGEIFGWRRPQPRRRPLPAAKAPETPFADLTPNDWVVHVDYGIGRFTGLVRRFLEGTEREFLTIEYADGDQLFVPVYQADRVTRYVGASGRHPSPSRLGSQEWQHTKKKVRQAVQETAQEMLALYANRQVTRGHAFSPDTVWQQELESSFPYIETEDQIRVINEVKQDMERSRPMDRLVCGDVGYGKTEVALRAAFKAVMDGKQVAILVPTTVLAQQHYRTFAQRLSAFPVEVEMLSRFRTPQQQREIIFRLAQGNVDILIGTHRLFSSDVHFKNLGLLIIDEEQRFGVTHKEQLKRMRTEVDVLTMTATPIPRTLYMALTSIRDISTINTPPEERLPVQTFTGQYDPKLVRKAILREIERGGQLFFVHNRVQTIHAMRQHLQKLVPHAKIGIGHGQMAEKELAHVMNQFNTGEIDILLSTSIVESGLDIPNANTLIVDRADTFGLAQLYQLRGRVGRGAQRAYAYFFRHRRKAPTPEGRLRLEILAETTELGAGYRIAMRDLEMRGAGDLLGSRQHGHMAAVGFHLYTRLLSQAVRQIQQTGELSFPSQTLAAPSLPQVSVELPLAIGLPESYLPDRNTRLGLYRRLANLLDLDQVDMVAEEWRDRFGPLPESAQHLLYQIKVKILAHKAGLSSVTHENEQLILRYPPLPEGQSRRRLHPLGENVISGKNAYRANFLKAPDWQDQLLTVLHKLAG